MDAIAARLRAEHGVAVDVLPADLTKVEDLGRVETRLREDARIGVLVNNAGAAAFGGFADPDLDALDRLIRLNITAVTRLAGAVVPRFLAQGGGSVINLASVLALAPEISAGIYAATKAFVLTFSQSLQAELGARGLYVQAVLPAATRTEIWGRAGMNIDAIPAVMDVGELVERGAGTDSTGRKRSPFRRCPMPPSGMPLPRHGRRCCRTFARSTPPRAIAPERRGCGRTMANRREPDMRILIVGAGAIGGYFGRATARGGSRHDFPRSPPARRAACANGAVDPQPAWQCRSSGPNC